MNPFWWTKDRGTCVICNRPLGKRRLSHFIEPPPFCLDDTDECKHLFAVKLGIDR